MTTGTADGVYMVIRLVTLAVFVVLASAVGMTETLRTAGLQSVLVATAVLALAIFLPSLGPLPVCEPAAAPSHHRYRGASALDGPASHSDAGSRACQPDLVNCVSRP